MNSTLHSQTAAIDLNTALRDCLPVIYAIAAKYASFHIHRDDLIQEGCIGVLDAAAHFDPSHKATFKTYASYWIRKRILEAIKQERRRSLNAVTLDDALLVPAPTAIDTEHQQLKILSRDIPVDEQTVLDLCVQEQRTLSETAEALHLSRERVRQLRQKALRRLRCQTAP